MKERKNIDRLFQEKFKDFEQTPREEVWKNIAQKLQEKEEKKPVILPFWFKLGSVAAILALIITGAYFYQNNVANITEPQITIDIEKSALPNIEMPVDSTLRSANKTLDELSESSEYSNTEDKVSTNNSGAIANQNNAIRNNQNSSSDNSISAKTEKNSKNNNLHQSKKEQQLANLENKIQDNPKEKAQDRISEEAVTSSAKKKKENQIAIADSTKFNDQEKYEKAVAILEQDQNKDATTEEIKIASNKTGKISISPFAAPVYYDNLGTGSPLDPDLAGNQTNSEVTMSYGIKLAYAISEKVKIRSGINKVNMNYKTQDIVYNYAMASNNLANINYENGSENIKITSTNSRGNGGYVFDSPVTSPEANNFSMLNVPVESGSINQSFGYIEVPLEIEYNLIDKKIGLKLIGGASSLFLDENSVSVTSKNGEIELGEANNLEKLSFTTNIGMGVDYQLSDHFRLNLEPTFKYQLNSFNNVDGVNPFFFGLYTGFSFEF
ncbi:hypothetical protein [Zunongwangia endophytica]|uniref:Outer membrane protein beta-barrel domain-containing protein n=1 Tax=Zunongwangia endophytica TaxID=1808945 RepID=A0ABV8H6L1_9FLAO|nr:hypothetical protein [Zunongwangia endophytica]MDN3595864.1 hypothetical protein [Zunongwangia endophytica]